MVAIKNKRERMRGKGYKGIDRLKLENAIAMSEGSVIEHSPMKTNTQRCTCGKINYASDTEARKFIKWMRNKNLGKKYYAYKCPESNNFHIATK